MSASIAAPRYPPTSITISGLQVIIHGLTTLPTPPCTITAVYLLHPRLQVSDYMAPIAAAILDAATSPTLCIAFDQRNHGTREIEPFRNEAWRQGNERHALDLFSSYQGTAHDLSGLIGYLPAYLFPDGSHTIARHIVAGVSLGGHAAWVSILADPRIEAAGVIIGCADYLAMTHHRATKSRLVGYVAGESVHFPATLMRVVERYDPAAIGVEEAGRRLKGKRVLCLSGGADKLVPYECSKSFIEALDKVEGVDIASHVFDGVGHECTPEMVALLAKWVRDIVESGRERISEEKL